MIADRERPGLPSRRYHLWPHGARVLDLGDDAHAAARVRDLAAYDYALRGVRLRDAGPIDVVAYYDGQHQSGLTQDQRGLVRAWVRRHAAAACGARTVAADAAPFWTSYVAGPPVPATPAATRPADRRAGAERARWLALALLPAALALAVVAYGVALDGASSRGGGPVLASTAAVLALISAVIAWRHTGRHTGRHAGRFGPRAPVRRGAVRTAGSERARRAGRSFTSTPHA